MDKNKDKIIIFTDGASKGNPGPGGFGAVIVFPKGEVVELGGFEKHTTNNRMELSGAINAFEKVKKEKEEVVVYTDSKYLINGMTGWVFGWQKNNWQKKKVLADRSIEFSDVLNQDLWKKLADLTMDKKITWHYVGGHVGIAGNERCDEIADALATGQKVTLYKGPLAKYKINIMDLGHNEQKKEIKSNKGAKAYSYLSLVDGVLNIDKTWAECEKRVKGKKGVKFQKAVSKYHEEEIIKNWGINE
jgi:ribonuclease HI